MVSFVCESQKDLFKRIEKLLLDTKRRIAQTDEAMTSKEIKREDIRLTAKNVAEIEKMFVCLLTERDRLGSNFG